MKSGVIKYFLILVCTSTGIFAQSKIEFGFTLGMSSHGGDATSWGRHGISMFSGSHLALGCHVAYPYTENLRLRLQFRSSKLEGDDTKLLDKRPYGPEHVNRGFQYSSNLYEIAILGQYDLIKSKKRNYRHSSLLEKVSLYAIGGFAYAIIDDVSSRRFWGNQNNDRILDIQLDQEQGSKGGVQIPIGLGINYSLNDNWGINLYYSLRLPLHDYLDGISESANPDKNDSYQFCGIELIYRL